MFYEAHFIIDVTNWSRGVWVDGTVQVMDREDILLSDRLAPTYAQEFPDRRHSANEALASMVGVAKIYDRILTLADKHGLHVDEDVFSTLTVSSGGAKIGSMMVAMRRSGVELAPGRLDSPDRSDAVEEAWGWFCARIRENPDSRIV